MASRVISTLIDDLDGTVADETVLFGIDGATYEIDLTAEHAQGLRDSITEFVNSARRTGGRLPRSRRHISSGPNKGAKVRASNDPKPADVREWAKKKRKSINDRGRVPTALIEEYKAAHNLV